MPLSVQGGNSGTLLTSNVGASGSGSGSDSGSGTGVLPTEGAQTRTQIGLGLSGAWVAGANTDPGTDTEDPALGDLRSTTPPSKAGGGAAGAGSAGSNSALGDGKGHSRELIAGVVVGVVVLLVAAGLVGFFLLRNKEVCSSCTAEQTGLASPRN